MRRGIYLADHRAAGHESDSSFPAYESGVRIFRAGRLDPLKGSVVRTGNIGLYTDFYCGGFGASVNWNALALWDTQIRFPFR